MTTTTSPAAPASQSRHTNTDTDDSTMMTTTSASRGRAASPKDAHPVRVRLCYSYPKPKGPMLENIFGYAVASPTDKRGFVMSGLVRHGVARVGMVAGGMGHTVRLAARRIPCFQHPAHPLRLKTRLVDSEPRYGVLTMTQAVTLARTAAPITLPAGRTAAPTFTDTTDRDTIALHVQAENALSMALSMLRNPSGTADDLQRATARAIRAATLLKRACAAQVEGGAA